MLNPLASVSARSVGMLSMLAAWMLWAMDPIMVRLIGEIQILPLAGSCMLTGGLCALGPALSELRRRPKVLWKTWLLFACYCLFCTVMADLCYLMAVKYIHPSLVSVTLRSQIILVIIIGWFTLRERVSLVTALGVAVIVAANLGNGVMQWGKIASDGGSLAFRGWMFALIAVFLWGPSTVIGKILLRSLAPITLSGLRLTFSGLFLLAAGWVAGGAAAFTSIAPRQWLIMGLRGTLISAFAYTLYFYGLHRSKAQVAASIEQLAPLFSMLYAWMILHQMVTPAEFALVMTIFAGTCLAIFGSREAQPA